MWYRWAAGVCLSEVPYHCPVVWADIKTFQRVICVFCKCKWPYLLVLVNLSRSWPPWVVWYPNWAQCQYCWRSAVEMKNALTMNTTEIIKTERIGLCSAFHEFEFSGMWAHGSLLLLQGQGNITCVGNPRGKYLLSHWLVLCNVKRITKWTVESNRAKGNCILPYIFSSFILSCFLF